MPCKQVLLAFEFRRGRRKLRAASAHDRCAPLHHRHHHRNRQHQRHTHDMPDDTDETGHKMIVIGERAIDLRCMWQVLDGRTKPCAVRSVMAGRSLDTVRSLGWQDEALRGTLRDVRAQLCNNPSLFDMIMTKGRLLRCPRGGNTTRRPCQ